MLWRNPGATAILIDLPNSDKSNHRWPAIVPRPNWVCFAIREARSVAMPSLLRLALFLEPLSKPHVKAAAVLVDELNPQFVLI